MANWYEATEAGANRIELAWKDAPTENLELCELIFETAREQVLAYAPAPDATTGVIVPGPITVARTNLFPNPDVMNLNSLVGGGGQTALSYVEAAARWTLLVASAVGITINVPAVTGVAARILVRARANRALTAVLRLRAATGPAITIGPEWAWFDLTVVAGAGAIGQSGILLPSNAGHVNGDWIEVDRVLYAEGGDTGPHFSGASPDQIIDGVTYDYAWTGALNASPSVATYRPDVFEYAVPIRYVYAQLQQARNLHIASRVDGGGDIGGEFSFTPRPLDKTIKNIIRPESLATDVY